ncbi:transcriptional regulator [Thermoclostridium stercorarium subsp. stercorarium DSM 8532]|jgi:two-component system response regulator YesN|uniref:Stage 0 sporulation protein A homolog n=2 Tax=Thermoclostridium stercorarium TaxID=1510 RepID=L7VSU4_THES1|nr:response regulator [Thermoclostridium stercorarium]AGC68613.1 transcriptional regulator [Thermoclostridium stercorarium subsp. stercorarium DSM 8532]AGI39624.1 response regulator [Thermoclostridium stercorarium subsp. stercorarium DSM 8532]ANW98957.1 two-component system response regulator [Thermoclostridium stercorarium subsp. thermolacticum DSM 2910]
MYKLIIIDDEKIIRETIGSMIDWKSIDVELVGLCSNGMEGLDMIIDEDPDIVMTDIRMPVFSGLELIKRIRQLNKDIEFIILSGYSEFEYARTAMALNVKYYILKPCSKETIINTVKQAIEDCCSKKKTVPSYIFKIARKLSQDFIEKIKQPEEIINDMFNLLSDNNDCDYVKAVVLSFLTNIWYSYVNLIDSSIYYNELENSKTKEEIMEFLNGHLKLLSQKIIRNSKPLDSSKEFIKKCIEYAKENFSNPSLTLKYIAENYLYMNVDYVSRQFCKITGEKFSTFLGRLRVENAKDILRKNPDEKIYTVAEMVGCGNNPQYLTQLFKKYEGITPSAFVNLLKGNA